MEEGERVDGAGGGEGWWVVLGRGRVDDGWREGEEFGAEGGLEGGVLGEGVDSVRECYAGGFVAGCYLVEELGGDEEVGVRACFGSDGFVVEDEVLVEVFVDCWGVFWG